MTNLSLEKLCSLINLSTEITAKITTANKRLNEESIKTNIQNFRTPKNWEKTYSKSYIEQYKKDDGIQTLTLMLLATLDAYKDYQKLKISDKIFIDTFCCFSRFVKEHLESFEKEGFDRHWWTVRQVSLKLFRIDSLEYEIIEKQKELQLSLHIPSDCNLSKENTLESLQNAIILFNKHFPKVNTSKIFCSSWLLAPNLRKVLPSESKIIGFQNLFTISHIEYEHEDYREWVFKNSKLPLEQLPENTSLQKNLKQFILNGNRLGIAQGYIKKEIINQIRKES